MFLVAVKSHLGFPRERTAMRNYQGRKTGTGRPSGNCYIGQKVDERESVYWQAGDGEKRKTVSGQQRELIDEKRVREMEEETERGKHLN